MNLAPGWSSASLTELGEWVGGGTPSKSRPEFWVNGKIPWISPKDMKLNVIRTGEDQITQQAIAASATSVVQAPAVLVVVRSGILKHSLPVAVTAVDVTLNQDMKALSPRQGIDPSYLAWALRRFSQDILHSSSKAGTTVSSIEFPSLKRFVIPVAPSQEQRRIVAAIEEHLSSLDAAVAALERVRAALPRYRAAVLKAACEGRLVESSGGWAMAAVGDLAQEIRYGHTASAKPIAHGPRFLRITDIQDDHVDWDTVPGCEIEQSEVTKYLLKDGDLVFARTGATTGKSYLIQQAPHAVFASYLIRVRLKPRMDPRFVYAFFRSPAYWRQIAGHRRGTGQPNVNATLLSSVQMPVPPLEEQTGIVAEVDRRLSLADAAERAVSAGLAKANRLRQAILKRAFEGKLVPQDPNDEPASVLLERIKAAVAPGANRRA